jgi:hypothetical protein
MLRFIQEVEMTRVELKQAVVVVGFAAIVYALGVFLPENVYKTDPVNAFVVRLDALMFILAPWPARLRVWMRS